MDLTNMISLEGMREMKCKRIAFISNTVGGYTSLEEYAKDNDEWFAIIGMDLRLHGKYISIENWLDCYEYEKYYIIMASNGRLTVKDKIKRKYISEI